MSVFMSVSRRGSVNEHFPMGCQSMPLTERKGEVLAAWETFEWLTTTRMRYLRRRCKWHINAAAWSAQPFLHSAPGGGYWTTYVASCAASAWDFEALACQGQGLLRLGNLERTGISFFNMNSELICSLQHLLWQLRLYETTTKYRVATF